MCVTATILAAASLATAAAGTGLSIASANANAAAQEEQLQIQQKQYVEQLQTERLQAAEAEANRLSEFRRQRAANLAAMAASGLSENMSFLQGIAPAEKKALGIDLANIRLGLLGQESRMADEIRVNALSQSMVKANRSAAVAGSLINFASTATQIGSFYDTYRTPGKVGGNSVSGTAPSLDGLGSRLVDPRAGIGRTGKIIPWANY